MMGERLPRVYLDTVIVHGRTRKDLRPVEEMAAVDALYDLAAAGRIEIVTSKQTRIEQERTPDPELRSQLAARTDDVALVPNDHRLLGFNTLRDNVGGFFSGPLISDIIDEELLGRLKTEAGLEEADARHVMYAVRNGCDYFVTLDEKDLLPNRSSVDAICKTMRVLKPTEAVKELL